MVEIKMTTKWKLMKIMADIQKDDPPCPYKEKPCHRWHHETIERGLPCPCTCHYTKDNIDKWEEGLDHIVNADEVADHIRKMVPAQ